MKKIICHCLISGCLLFSACSADNISKLRFEVNVVSKCYNQISFKGDKSCSVPVVSDKQGSDEIEKANLALLPAYSWDPKLLAW